MKVKIKKVPYIEMIGDWMRITYKEETVIEESITKKVFNVLKSGSVIFSMALLIIPILSMCFSDDKIIWFFDGVTITACVLSILIDFLKEFKN